MAAVEHLSEDQFNWRSQTVPVYGRPRPLGDVHGGRLFHGSPHEIAAGTVLRPGEREKNFKQSADEAVSITSSAHRAHYWAAQSGSTPHVYEVEPLGVVEAHRVGPANGGKNIALHEGRTPTARVVREVPEHEWAEYPR